MPSQPSPSHRRVGSVDTESYHSIDPDDALGPIRIMSYNDRNHWSVITQLYGSTWPATIPYCVANMIITLLVFYFFRDRTFSSTGHHFMALILSFLVVSRAQITYSRYMEASGDLAKCYKACRELVQHMCVLTQEDKSVGATVWRHNVAYRTIILLRVTMAAIEFQSQRSNPWEIPELTMTDQKDMEATLFINESKHEENVNSTIRHLGMAGHHSTEEECFRAPILLAYALRKEIMEQRTGAYLEKPFRHVNEELKMLDCVTDFMTAFHGLKKLVETPFPFPLVQMARTFLFVWLFTLPFVLCHDDSQYPFDALLMIFLTTFGFLGLEYVCMELDDPFGDDPNDFDDLGMAQLVFEDIYISIYKLDGDQAAYQLRRKIVARIKRGPALQNFTQEYQHRYSPTIEEDTIEFDRRKQFQKTGSGSNVPFRFTKETPAKPKKKSSFKNLSHSLPFRKKQSKK